jgi:hypothetical protein
MQISSGPGELSIKDVWWYLLFGPVLVWSPSEAAIVKCVFLKLDMLEVKAVIVRLQEDLVRIFFT